MLSPSGTGSAPLAVKSFCRSTRIKAFMGNVLGFSWQIGQYALEFFAHSGDPNPDRWKYRESEWIQRHSSVRPEAAVSPMALHTGVHHKIGRLNRLKPEPVFVPANLEREQRIENIVECRVIHKALSHAVFYWLDN